MGSFCSCCHKERKLNFFLESSQPLLESYKSIGKCEEINSIKDLKIRSSNFILRSNNQPFDIYDYIDEIGQGAYGKVFKVVHKMNKEIRAIKIINKTMIFEGLSESEVFDEIKILKSLDHPNIIKIYEFFVDAKNIYIVTEYCEEGDLYHKFIQISNFSEKIVCNIMRQILSAVSYLHSKNIIHGDLKLENILIDSNMGSNKKSLEFVDIKLIDFGCSKIFDVNKRNKGFIGTAYYIAPEVLKNNYNEMCDIWSCGVITFILLTGKPPFYGKNQIEILQSTLKKKEGPFSRKELGDISETAIDIINNMLMYEDKLRPSAVKLLRHQWFKIITSNTIQFIDKTYTMKVVNNLRKFHYEKKFQQAIITFITHNFAKRDEVNDLRNVFRYLDVNGDGRISFQELELGLKSILGDIETEEVRKIMINIDFDQNQFIEYEEFLRASIDQTTLLSECNLKQAFDMFDMDKGGTISSEEVKNIISGGQIISDDVVKDIFQELNKEMKDEISFDEFKFLMEKIVNNK